MFPFRVYSRDRCRAPRDRYLVPNGAITLLQFAFSSLSPLPFVIQLRRDSTTPRIEEKSDHVAHIEKNNSDSCYIEPMHI